jgi:hypothetical protein
VATFMALVASLESDGQTQSMARKAKIGKDRCII